MNKYILNILPKQLILEEESVEPTTISLEEFNKLNIIRYNKEYNRTFTICCDDFSFNESIIK